MRTLKAISATSHVEVNIISGRDRNTLGSWFDHLDIHLVAEHGMWIKEKGLFDFVLAAGDDTTDEDLFKILPTHAFSVRVGMVSSQAKFNVRDYRELRALLEEMAK